MNWVRAPWPPRNGSGRPGPSAPVSSLAGGRCGGPLHRPDGRPPGALEVQAAGPFRADPRLHLLFSISRLIGPVCCRDRDPSRPCVDWIAAPVAYLRATRWPPPPYARDAISLHLPGQQSCGAGRKMEADDSTADGGVRISGSTPRSAARGTACFGCLHRGEPRRKRRGAALLDSCRSWMFVSAFRYHG
jgi:hypothetical protein